MQHEPLSLKYRLSSKALSPRLNRKINHGPSERVRKLCIPYKQIGWTITTLKLWLARDSIVTYEHSVGEWVFFKLNAKCRGNILK